MRSGEIRGGFDSHLKNGQSSGMNVNRPKIQALDHVAIEVRDLGAAIDFYENVLGLTELPAPPVALEKGIRWYALPEDRMLHLVWNPDATSARVGHLAFRVSDVQEWKAYFDSVGVLEEEATVKLYGTVERIFVRDPSGNRLEFLKWGEK